MTIDYGGRDDWLDDVRRWYHAGGAVKRPAMATVLTGEGGLMPADEALGYEAAHPALQARHWPDAPRVAFADTL